MEFTGSQLTLKRNFYPQNNNFGISCSIFVNNPTGEYKIGVSGTNNFEVVLKSGQIFKDDLFLHSYAPFEEMTLDFQFYNSSYNFYKNEKPIILGGSKTSGDYDYFYITRENTNLNADFDLFISGSQQPSYTISEFGYWLSSGQAEVTGSFTNNGSYNIKVFNSSAQTPGGISFDRLTGVLEPGGTGYFKYTGSSTQFLSVDFDQPIFTSFNTNFNQATVNFRIIDARSVESFIFLQPISNFNFDSNNEISRTLTYNNYSGGVIANFPTSLVFSLEYVSGTGFFSESEGTYSTTGNGTFIESGLITGIASTVTGNILVQTTGWATGEAGGIYSGIGTGYATGIGYSGLASGIFTGFLTGTIYDGSGKLSVGYPALGYGYDAVSLPEASYATGIAYLPVSQQPTLFSWNSGDIFNRPYFYVISGSGNREFTSAGNNGTIYFASGEDILYGMSGMNTAFGITGWMSGTKLYLFTTGTFGVQTTGCYLRSASASSALYPGVGIPYPASGSANSIRRFIGAISGVTPATGYIDLSKPAYTNTDDIRIGGYQSRILTCRYRPDSTIQSNIIFEYHSGETYYCFYDDAETLANLVNEYSGVPFTASYTGNTVYFEAKDFGTAHDLEFFVVPPYIGISGTEGIWSGGSPSSKATGYITLRSLEETRHESQVAQNINFNTSAALSRIGQFEIYANGYTFYFAARKFLSEGIDQITVNQEFLYYRNINQLIETFSGSAIGKIWMDIEYQDAGSVKLTAKELGETGNYNYHRSGFSNNNRRNLTGGGISASNTPVIQVGEYTGALGDTYISGSGTYFKVLEETGSVFIKTFTGQWDILTGLSPSQLISIKNQYINDTLISTTGLFDSNSEVYFKIDHDPIYSVDQSIFRISGDLVFNPLSQTLTQ